MARRIAEDLLGYKEKAPSINSKQKGSRNELILAKVLTQWTGVKFQRVPQSGAYRWENAINLIGDVTPSDLKFEFPFVVETKFYSKVEFKPNMRSNSKIFTFWRQVLDDSERAKKVPILFVRINGMGSSRYKVFVDEDVAKVFESIGLVKEFIASNDTYTLAGFKSEDLVLIPYERMHNIVQKFFIK
jgi:hypothetical protein